MRFPLNILITKHLYLDITLINNLLMLYYEKIILIAFSVLLLLWWKCQDIRASKNHRNF